MSGRCPKGARAASPTPPPPFGWSPPHLAAGRNSRLPPAAAHPLRLAAHMLGAIAHAAGAVAQLGDRLEQLGVGDAVTARRLLGDLAAAVIGRAQPLRFRFHML